MSTPVERLTRRLDHIVPDPKVAASVNADAAKRLDELARILADALPDPTLSPDERLERLARVVQTRIPEHNNLLPATHKLHVLERRLAELVPGNNLSATERLEFLISTVNAMAQVNKLIDDSNLSIAQKLEKLGDARAGFSSAT